MQVSQFNYLSHSNFWNKQPSDQSHDQLFNLIEINRPQVKSFEKPIDIHFQSLMQASFSSLDNFDNWVFSFLLAIKDFKDESQLFHALYPETQSSQKGVEKAYLLDYLERNIGIDNTFALLANGYQLAYQLNKNALASEKQRTEAPQQILRELIQLLLIKSPHRFSDTNFSRFVINKSIISSEFFERLKPQASLLSTKEKVTSGQVVKGIALAALGIVSYFLYQQLSSPTLDYIPIKFLSRKYLRGCSSDIFPELGRMPNCKEAEKISLYQFSEMTIQQKEEAIVKFELQASIESWGNEDFFARLAKKDKSMLELVDLTHVYISEPVVDYILMPDEDFNKLTLKDIQYIHSLHSEFHVIRYRLNAIEKRAIPDEDLLENMLDMPLIDFANLTGKQINQCAKAIPSKAFGFLSNKQIKELDFTNLDASSLYHLGVITSLTADHLSGKI